ncbi:hypothetical protein BGZ49_005092 [Haplosporangium sp. Z 27]|nr:hypothetical protein BGZ49_005092 [Haplosporangium sp. Z 27]
MADQQLKEYSQSVYNWVRAFPRNTPRYIHEKFPIIKWDVVAGITVGLIVVPQGMSYAKVAELPVQNGLYSAYIGAFVYCFMGTSKDLAVGPTAVISLITGELVNHMAGTLTPQQVAATSCLLVGLFTAILGIVRLGIILDFFPTTVLVGYTTGAAATIIIQQLPGWLGVPGINNRDPVYTIIINMFKAFGHINWRDLLFGLISMFLLIAIGLAVDRWGRGKFSIQVIKISRFFIVTALATAISYAITKDAPLDAQGNRIPSISILKTVPSGLPKPKAPELTNISPMIGKLLAIALATILEHIAIGKAFARRNRYKIDANQELVALGVGNIIASFFGAYTVTGSFSRSAVKFQCGVKTPIAGLLTGTLVLISVFWLTSVFYYIPSAALCAVIMVAVFGLVSPPTVFYQFFKINLWDFLSSQIALWVTIFKSVEVGIASGVGFSLVVMLFRIARPKFHMLRQLKDRPDVYIDSTIDSSLETIPAPHGILVFRIEESTTFPNTEYLKNWVVEEAYKYTRFGGKVKAAKDKLWADNLDVHISELRKQAHGPDSNITDNDLPKLRAVVLDFSAVNNIDTTGLQGLFDMRVLLKEYAGAADYPELFFELHFVGIQANVLKILELSGITKPVEHIALETVEVIGDGDDVSNDDEIEKTESFDSIQTGSSTIQSTNNSGQLKIESTRSRPLPGGNGAAALSVTGAGYTPFLKEKGLVHLTVRDAIDSILIRHSAWNHNIKKGSEAQSSTESPTSDSDEDVEPEPVKDKTEIGHVV